MKPEYLKNFSYLFIPVTTQDLEQFPHFSENITQQNGWKSVPVENRYLHKYVAERVSIHANTNHRFRLDADFAQQHGLCLGNKWYSSQCKNYKDEKNIQFEFLIANVDMYVFHPDMCILAYELRFRDNDPLKIAAAQYYLRKLSSEPIRLAEDKDEDSNTNFIDISKELLSSCSQNIPLDFFFYAIPKSERANFLTYLDVPRKESYDEELYYLKWCYSDAFDYSGTNYDEDSENYISSAGIVWGISVSAAVCLVSCDEKIKSFVENVFQKNFREQYLFTYILLLHQKYMMYLFLTKMSVGLEGDLEQLKKYKAKLYDFETHYMFSSISEVPQYQRFYAKVEKAFALKEMFRDVQEPMSQLAEIQQQEAEIKKREHDNHLNQTITILSILTVVSALTDAADIPSNLTWLFKEVWMQRTVQGIALGFVFFVIGWLVYRLISLKKK